MSKDITAETDELFNLGLEIRREVLGKDYVDASLASANDFTMAFQRITTEWCWGYGWGRPGLDRKTRSLINLAMLTALNRPAEIKLHVRGALNNGCTVEEIKEVLPGDDLRYRRPRGFRSPNAVQGAVHVSSCEAGD